MKYDILIKNGTIVDAKTNPVIKDVAIKDGFIVDIDDEIDEKLSKKTIFADGQLVMPGLIDTHVHAVREDCKDEGFRMLLRAGVTTAIDFKGPSELFLKNFKASKYKPNLAYLNGIYHDNGFIEEDISYEKIREFSEQSVRNGSLGVKILGGHFPVTNDTLMRSIDICNDRNYYIAIHCGNTVNGSNIKGFLDAVEAANNKSLHIAHVNSYCRGLIYDEIEEAKIALEKLEKNRNLVSESYLSDINGTSGSIDDNMLPKSHVTRNCLKLKGYEQTFDGLKKAILDSSCAVYYKTGDEMQLHYGKDAYEYWVETDYNANLSFSVNPLVSRVACAVDKTESGDFTIDAISTDGGAIPRNSILDKGLLIVELGGLTLQEFTLKTSFNPAKMLALKNKGLIKVEYDADIIVVDKEERKASYTILDGEIVSNKGVLSESRGKMVILEDGENEMKLRDIDYQIVDLKEGIFYQDNRRGD